MRAMIVNPALCGAPLLAPHTPSFQPKPPPRLVLAPPLTPATCPLFPQAQSSTPPSPSVSPRALHHPLSPVALFDHEAQEVPIASFELHQPPRLHHGPLAARRRRCAGCGRRRHGCGCCGGEGARSGQGPAGPVARAGGTVHSWGATAGRASRSKRAPHMNPRFPACLETNPASIGLAWTTAPRRPCCAARAAVRPGCRRRRPPAAAATAPPARGAPPRRVRQRAHPPPAAARQSGSRSLLPRGGPAPGPARPGPAPTRPHGTCHWLPASAARPGAFSGRTLAPRTPCRALEGAGGRSVGWLGGLQRNPCRCTLAKSGRPDLQENAGRRERSASPAVPLLLLPYCWREGGHQSSGHRLGAPFSAQVLGGKDSARW